MESSQLSIRRGAVTDAPALAAFGARTFADSFGSDNRPEDMKSYLSVSFGVSQQTRELTDPSVITVLAHRAETLIAYAQVRHETPPACVTHDRPIQLYRFYVDRSAHGQGIAQLLMAEVHQAVCEFCGLHVWLSVWERNPRGIAFYKKVGFLDVGSVDFFVGADRQRDRVLVAKVRPGHVSTT